MRRGGLEASGRAAPSPRAAGPGEAGRRALADARCLAWPRLRPHTWGVIVVAVVVALLGVAVTANRVAVIRAQGWIARQIQDRGFPAEPQVTIAGFPFLAQVAARRLDKVVIRVVGQNLGPVEVKRLDLTLRGIRVSGRTASRLSGTALVGFAGLAGMPGLTLCAGGPDRVKITVGLGPVSGTATARVTRAGRGGIRIAVISVGGIPVAVPGPLRDISVPLPALPPGVTIKDVSVTGQGVLVHLAGQNVSLGS